MHEKRPWDLSLSHGLRSLRASVFSALCQGSVGTVLPLHRRLRRTSCSRCADCTQDSRHSFSTSTLAASPYDIPGPTAAQGQDTDPLALAAVGRGAPQIVAERPVPVEGSGFPCFRKPGEENQILRVVLCVARNRDIRPHQEVS